MSKKSRSKKSRAKKRSTDGSKQPAGGAAGQPPAGPQASPAEPPPSGAQPVGETLLYVLLGVLAVGVAIALYLVRHKLKITLDPAYVSACNLGGAIDCDRVNTSYYSNLFGLPISLLAIPTYLVMAYFVVHALRSRRDARADVRASGELALQATAAIGLATIAYSIFLAWVSSVWIRAYCLFCISLYVVNIAATVLALRAGTRSPLAAVGGALRGLLSMRAPIPISLAVVVAGAAVSYGGYSAAKGSMTEAYKRRIDAQLAEPVDIDTDSVATEPPPSDEPAASTRPAVQAPTPVAAQQTSPLGTRGGKKTDDGWTYFEAPLEQADFADGPADAKVTVVKYADFQCAYCRQLAQSFEQVHDKYGDRVRFVMKHFPMHVSCNRSMRGFDKHPVACEMAYASQCAGEQGKFWEMHDELYHNQPSLTVEAARGYAEKLDLDMSAYDACVASPETAAKIKRDIDSALYAGIYGTPRTYINNRLVTGSANAAILEYYIEKAFEAADQAERSAADVPAAPKPAGGAMIEARTASATFYIDAYEGAVTKDGRAVTQPGVEPAEVDYYAAKQACEKAGKRICTEEEWVSACMGVAAVDDNNNKMFADDLMEGNMYPYGPYHEDGFCHDRADKREGESVATGSKAQCRTRSGIFDLAGNIAEWGDGANGKPTLLGGSMSSATGAACNRRTFSSPPGSRNRTTGFRCCADSNVAGDVVAASELAENLDSLLDLPVPAFEVEDSEANRIASDGFKDQVTLVNFFASWCGPCKRELPFLVGYVGEYGPQGLRIVGVGVDQLAERSLEFAAEHDVNFPVVTDVEAVLKGRFLVYEMPATFLVDREGVIRYAATGFSGEDQEGELRAAIEDLLAK